MQLKCLECGRCYPPTVELERCTCGAPLSLEGAGGRGVGCGVWRYRPYLPSVSVELSLGEASTPLIPCVALREQIGLSSLYVKDESRNPTGSYVDRGSAVLASVIVSSGFTSVSLHGDGNYIASMGAYLARAGIKAFGSNILSADMRKMVQASLYGVEEPRSECSLTVSYHNPYMLEGLKTISLELVEQLDGVPSAIMVPTATGALLFSIYKGFKELLDQGEIGQLPTLYAAVSKGHPLASPKPAYSAAFLPVTDETYLRATKKALEETNGAVVEVSDAEMIRFVRVLARAEGVLAEPSAAASIAACFKLSRKLASNTRPVVALVTGSGLKSLDIMAYHTSSLDLQAAPHAVRIEILKVIAEQGPIHAYGVYKALRERRLPLSPQLVHAYLKHLSKRGLVYAVKVASQRKKRVFYLTPAGRLLLSLAAY